MWVRRTDLELLEGEPSRYTVTGESGKTKVACYCAKCTARLWGEPIKAPDLAIVQAVESDEPPFYFLLGKAALKNARLKLDALKADFDKWADVTEGADFPEEELAQSAK